MATLSTCPRCSRMVTLPEGLNSGAMVRCPLCQSEYRLTEAQALVPPMLVSLEAADQTAEAPSFSPPANGSEDFCITETSPADPKIDLGLPDSQKVNAALFTPLITSTSAVESTAPGTGNSNRRKSSSKSILRRLLEIELAGIMGLLIVYYALWWIRGDQCGLPRFSWLPFLPTAKTLIHSSQSEGVLSSSKDRRKELPIRWNKEEETDFFLPNPDLSTPPLENRPPQNNLSLPEPNKTKGVDEPSKLPEKATPGQ